MKRFSITDLAEKLKVSKTLVSLVLNGKGDEYGINKQTQQRVLRTAKKLNYRPNLMARGLRKGHSHMIAVVVADISNPFYSRISKSIEDHVSRKGYNIIVCSTDEDPVKEQRLVTSLVNEQNVAGIIIATTQKSAGQFVQLQKSNFPIVLIDREASGGDFDYVGVDNTKGAQLATEHLIKSGFRRIGLLKITPSFLSTIRERTEGYNKALSKHKIKPDKSLVHEIEFSDLRAGVRRAMKELTTNAKADAVFVLNSNLAAYAMEYINEKGLQVPGDIGVISFDDVDYFRFSNPPVSAVAQPLDEIGKSAAEQMLQRLAAKSKSGKRLRVQLEPRLIERKSTKG
jgi:LacI family transcriptional regulator